MIQEFNLKTLLLSNSSVRQTIAKNTIWLSASTVLNKLLSLALLIYAARILGAEGYGEFTFALSFVSLLMIFATFGLPPIITREFSRGEENKNEFYSIISLKLLLAIGTFLLIGGASFLVSAAQEVQGIILFLALFLLMNSFIGIGYAFFHARQKMEFEAWFESLQTILILAFGVIALIRFPSAESLSIAYFVAAIISLVALSIFFSWRIFPVRLSWDVDVWKKFLKMSWPLALMGLFGVVYSYTDSVMLGFLGLLEETGWYNGAYKIVTASLVPMGLIGAAFYPMLSKFSKESTERLQKMWEYEIEIMAILAVPLMIGGIAFADDLIYALYPAEFFPAIFAFQMLVVTAALIFLYRPLYDMMIVLNQEKKTFWITMAGAVINVGLNLYLIPKYGLYGAAAATIATHLLTLSVITIFIFTFTSLRIPLFKILVTLIGAVIATYAMLIMLDQSFFEAWSIFLLIPLGATIYIFLFGVLKRYVLIGILKQYGYDS